MATTSVALVGVAFALVRAAVFALLVKLFSHARRLCCSILVSQGVFVALLIQPILVSMGLSQESMVMNFSMSQWFLDIWFGRLALGLTRVCCILHLVHEAAPDGGRLSFALMITLICHLTTDS